MTIVVVVVVTNTNDDSKNNTIKHNTNNAAGAKVLDAAWTTPLHGECDGEREPLFDSDAATQADACSV